MAAENSNYYSYRFPERPQEKRCGSEEEKWSAIDEEDGWAGFLKEVDVEGREMMKRFEQVFRENWHHFRGKPVSHVLEKIAGERNGGVVMRERGDDLQGELKNERFKLKTNNLAGSGVVKEDDGEH